MIILILLLTGCFKIVRHKSTKVVTTTNEEAGLIASENLNIRVRSKKPIKLTSNLKVDNLNTNADIEFNSMEKEVAIDNKNKLVKELM